MRQPSRWMFVPGLLILAALIACGGNTPGGGTPAPGGPVVTIVSPADGATFAPGASVTVQATVTDPTGIQRVELLADGASAQITTVSDPAQRVFGATWTATTAGPHTLAVRAVNASNTPGEASVSIIVGTGTTAQVATGPTGTPGCALNSAFARDVTIPDGTSVPANQAFVKTWLIKNTGNCAWPQGAVLAFASGEAMTGDTQVPLPATNPGDSVQVSVNLTAPDKPGQHKGTWRPKLASGTAFGGSVTVVINVPGTTTPPTATPAPLVFNPPFPGGMTVNVSWSDNGLFIRAEANDSRVGQNNGDGITRVEFTVENLQGSVVATKTDNGKPYCFFGEADGDCTAAEPGTNAFRWRNGVPITAGWYFVRAVAYTQDNRIQVDEKPVNVTLPVESGETFFVDIDAPGNDVDALFAYEASPSGEGIDSASGAGIRRVQMLIEDYKGKKVSNQPESSPRYCGFGGGDNGQACPVYNFAEHNLRWPSGDPINPTQYVLRVIAFAQDGRIAATTRIIQINSLQ